MEMYLKQFFFTKICIVKCNELCKCTYNTLDEDGQKA